jgi:hypothetical protein
VPGKPPRSRCRQARENLIGEKPLTFTDLAADESAELGAERDILEQMVKRQKSRDFIETYDGHELDQARKQMQRLAHQQQQAS